MQEKRKFKRFIIEGMDVHCKMVLATEVEVLNISLGGALVSLNKRLNMGNEYTLKIDCGDNIVSLKGLVVWERLANLKKNENGELAPIYEAGLRFNETLSGKGADLIDFIEQNIIGKLSEARLTGTRVRILKPERATILGQYKSYYVKKLSQGGMLIETDQEFNKEERFQMELILQEGEYPINFLGRVASCLEMSKKVPVCYNTGIEFLGMSEENRSKLIGFIASLKDE